MLKRNLRQINPNRVDLHIHSAFSDGHWQVAQIVNFAASQGLKAISITDHDNISGLAEAERLCQKQGVESINGIELSVRAKSCDLHLLGYFFNRNDKNLIEYIEFFQSERSKRAREIVERLNAIGFNLKYQTVAQISANGSIGRPHIAQAMVAAGFASSWAEVFENYLGEGCKCFVPKFKIQPQDAISLLHQAGGLCILAHPAADVSDIEIAELIDNGLDGIETIHPKHSQAQVDHFRTIIQKYDLIETGGSDCHSQDEDNIFIGRLNIPYRLVERMKERWLQVQTRNNVVRSREAK